MIELRNLTKAYPVKNGFRYVLRDVSLIIPSRTNLAVIGPNGAGKSTLLRLIGGAEPADSGMIITDEKISWTFGLTSGFQGSLTGRENVMFVCRINGLSFDQGRHVINQVIDFAEIGEYFDMPVSTYSSGMRGRLSFGLSVAFEFDVYLIDEQTSVGDTIFKEKAKAAFEKIRKRASLIFVSHNLKTLKQSCQSALFIRDGMADFYPNIDDGLEAYSEYSKEHRNQGNPTEDSPTIASKRKRKKLDDVFNVNEEGESSLPTHEKHKTRQRKLRRTQKDLATSPQGELPDVSIQQKADVPAEGDALESLGGLPSEDPTVYKRALKKARRMARKAEKSLNASPEGGAPEIGRKLPSETTPARKRTQKMARRKARKAKKNLEASSVGDAADSVLKSPSDVTSPRRHAKKAAKRMARQNQKNLKTSHQSDSIQN